ncbi:MAG: hypothetical protein OXC60_16165 [Litoreibacter sp.]|nr:hypothetical protein [Litoreibacter sp.]
MVKGYTEDGLSTVLSPQRLGRLWLGEKRIAQLRQWNRKRREKLRDRKVG